MEVPPEVHYAKLLSSDQKDVSNKAVYKVREWISAQSDFSTAFTVESFMRLWKGFYHYVYNTDRQSLEDEYGELIGGIIHLFKFDSYSFLFIDTFFRTMAKEWLCIELYRMYKFGPFIRIFLRECFELLKRLRWRTECIKTFENILRETLLCPPCYESIPQGLKLYVAEIYMEELARISFGELTPQMVMHFIEPFCYALIKSENPGYIKSIGKSVFLFLVDQDPDQEYREYPMMRFDANSVQKQLLKFANKEGVVRMNIKIIYEIFKQFQTYKEKMKAYYSRTTGPRARKRHIEETAPAPVVEVKPATRSRRRRI